LLQIFAYYVFCLQNYTIFIRIQKILMFFENGKLYFDIFRKRLSSFGYACDMFLTGQASKLHSTRLSGRYRWC